MSLSKVGVHAKARGGATYPRDQHLLPFHGTPQPSVVPGHNQKKLPTVCVGGRVGGRWGGLGGELASLLSRGHFHLRSIPELLPPFYPGGEETCREGESLVGINHAADSVLSSLTHLLISSSQYPPQ
jgi:hypothetical protein